MEALLHMLSGPGGKSGGVQEDAWMAISTLTEVMGEGFLKYMDSFRPYLNIALQNISENAVSQFFSFQNHFLLFFVRNILL